MNYARRSCDVENMGDFCRYYQSSWVGRRPSDGAFIQPCYVGGMLDGLNVQLRPLVKQADGQIQLVNGFASAWEDIQKNVEFGTPDIGMVSDGPTILFCSYATPRAARKGYRPGDMHTSDFNGWDIRKKYISKSSVARADNKYNWIWHAFNPEYKTLVQAEDALSKGESVGVPISRTLGVYSLPKFKNSLLAYKRWTIGCVVNPYLIQLKREYEDYEEYVQRQTGAEVIVG